MHCLVNNTQVCLNKIDKYHWFTLTRSMVEMKLFVYLLVLSTIGLAQEWVENENEGYEYYYDDQAIVYSFDDAESKCAKQGATLVMIKTKEVEDFILGQGWSSKSKIHTYSISAHKLETYPDAL